jgi:hypothetical protein
LRFAASGQILAGIDIDTRHDAVALALSPEHVGLPHHQGLPASP